MYLLLFDYAVIIWGVSAVNAEFMKKAALEAGEGVARGEGGPFGAVIVRNGAIVASAHNTVILSADPTAHAEMNAIRAAAQKLGRFELDDCELYTSCEPCPMCLAAVHWARIPRLYYGCTADDAANAGFDDRFIYDVIRGETGERRVEMSQTGREECLSAFELWKNKKDRVRY